MVGDIKGRRDGGETLLCRECLFWHVLVMNRRWCDSRAEETDDRIGAVNH